MNYTGASLLNWLIVISIILTTQLGFSEDNSVDCSKDKDYSGDKAFVDTLLSVVDSSTFKKNYCSEVTNEQCNEAHGNVVSYLMKRCQDLITSDYFIPMSKDQCLKKLSADPAYKKYKSWCSEHLKEGEKAK